MLHSGEMADFVQRDPPVEVGVGVKGCPAIDVDFGAECAVRASIKISAQVGPFDSYCFGVWVDLNQGGSVQVAGVVDVLEPFLCPRLLLRGPVRVELPVQGPVVAVILGCWERRCGIRSRCGHERLACDNGNTPEGNRRALGFPVKHVAPAPGSFVNLPHWTIPGCLLLVTRAA